MTELFGGVGQQLENAARNRARIGKAGILRSAGIVRFIDARRSEAQKEIQARKKGGTVRERGGVYVQENPAIITPDGYVRRSPVQKIQTEPGYVKKRVRKAVGVILLALLILGAAALLMRYVSL